MVQELLEQSFLSADIILSEVSSVQLKHRNSKINHMFVKC